MSTQDEFLNQTITLDGEKVLASPSASNYLTPNQVFSDEQLTQLNQRSNWKGFVRLTGHLTVMGVSGYWWITHLDSLALGLPALVIYGFSFASMFAPMHECVHRTAFASNHVNDAIAGFAGLLSFYNSTFYRRYHKWHHRYTQIPGKDPELSDRKPTNLPEYLWQITGLPWWFGKIKTHFRVATGQLDDCPFIPETARKEVVRSVRWQLLVYLAAIAVSIYFQSFWFVLMWLLPLAIGQPILRMILLAEHTGCTEDANPTTNTRTTLTLFPIQFLMWNMPFHAEHHFCPSIPFHALANAHQQLKPHFSYVDRGYLTVNAAIAFNKGTGNTHSSASPHSSASGQQATGAEVQRRIGA
jgi:fatty acid desaturase